ncbi:MAG: carboxylesterase family protein [Myxococcales bacterium]|nr:carboxylesterase family protein [Myxococcales bacterium]
MQDEDRNWSAAVWPLVALIFATACGDDDASEVGDSIRGDGDSSFMSDAGSADEAMTVTIEDGTLQGDLVGGAVRFLKIPYAKPPVGDLRWKAPIENDPWEGVRHEEDFGSSCPQAPSNQNPGSQDEDCLYLNVWKPAGAVSGAPVMVWIHGGGFNTGSAGDLVPLTSDHLWHDGRYFAERHGVVLVSMNYRLGTLGFFAHPDLPDEGSPLGNQGLLDQRMALQWVQANIAAFGGDPDNVTIFGQSAGAGSVCLHMVSPGSRGLFHRAIGQSGGCGGGSGRAAADVADDVHALAADLGCEGEDALACLRGLPVSDLVSDEMINRTEGFSELRMRFRGGTVVDGEGGFLPEPAVDLLERGDVAQVPYILGATFEEAALYFLAAPVPETEEEFLAEIHGTYGDSAERVLELYPLSRFGGDIRKTMTRLSTDGTVCGIREHALRSVGAGLQVHLYDFNIAWSIANRGLGPCHASEISHVFGNPWEETDENIEVSDVMNEMWATFARSGNPNYEGAPVDWPLFEADRDVRIQFAPGLEILEDFRKDECDFWREYNALE